MEDHGVARRLCVSVLGAAESRAGLPFSLRYLRFPLYLRWAVADHEAQERIIADSHTDGDTYGVAYSESHGGPDCQPHEGTYGYADSHTDGDTYGVAYSQSHGGPDCQPDGGAMLQSHNSARWIEKWTEVSVCKCECTSDM